MMNLDICKVNVKLNYVQVFSFLVIGLAVRGGINFGILKGAERYYDGKTDNKGQVIESEIGVVATDDVRCSAVGVSMLKIGGHVVDAAVAAALCIGVVLQASSGIGGGSFMVVKSSSSSNAQAFDMRETAPISASGLRLIVSIESLK
ncbi:hypothetical protein RYX36_008265 [Vicia faba]